jgi:hypothetical protein
MSQEFLDTIKQRFAAIDVKKTQSLVKRRKTPEEALDIYNEIKFITSDDSTFALWSEVTTSHSQGELLDPETNPLKKFKENKNWRPEKEGVLNRAHTQPVGGKSCVCLSKGDDENDILRSHRLLQREGLD